MKKGLLSDKILLERLSTMTVEGDHPSPAITLSSIDDEESSSMDSCTGQVSCNRGTLEKSLSLDVPPHPVNLSQEAKRPPL